jgi:asparagine synthase (glutamine-hydrolysing)
VCGILGGINTDFTAASVTKLDHRGPDQSSFTTIETEAFGTVALGQTRLNIVDRSDITLPARVGDAAILFNGEIYNHPELRAELRSLGWSFETTTDTEVALTAYLQWGTDCLRRFNGMFALAIWDGERFFCARDRMGQKPLYYRCRGGAFEFASEIKAFRDLEFTTSELFSLFEFCFNEHTLYKDVLSLKPGHYLCYDLKRGTCHTTAWWDITHQVGRKITSETQAVDTFIDLLRDSVRLRMRSDVPVTMFLAGGVDSSLIAALSGIDEAFTCQFDEFKNSINEELFVADLTSRLGIRANYVRPTRDEFMTDLPSLGFHLEIPTGSFSVFPLYRLAKAVHQRDYRVVLSGEGSDELFTGYARNELLLGDELITDDDKRRHYRAMLERYHGSDLDRFCRMASRSGLGGAAMLRAYLTDHWSERKSMLENVSYIESRIFLQPLLQMADRMCMAHSVENRCPFLDHRLVEFASSLDDSLRYRDGIGKWIVHQAAKKLLPKGALVLQRKVKDGLPTPVNLWMYGAHSFDRKHWNAIMTAECIKTLLGGTSAGRIEAQRSVNANELLPPKHTSIDQPVRIGT